MNLWLWLIPALLLLVLGIALMWYFRRKNKIFKGQKEKEYQEVLNDFQAAEQLYEDSLKGGGEYDKPNPYEILWSLERARRHQFTRERTRGGIELPALPKLPGGQPSVQGYANEWSNEEQSTSGREQPTPTGTYKRHKRGIFRRRSN